MHILFLVNNYPEVKNPYAGVFVHNQVKALLEKGIDAKVLYLDFRSVRRVRKWGMKKYEYDGVTVYRFAIPCGPLKKLYYWLIEHTSVHAFKQVLKAEKDIACIHAHFTDMGLAAGIIKDYFHVPYILTEHSSTLIQDNISVEEENVICRAYEKADRLLAVGSVLRARMRKYSEKEITVLPNVLADRFKFNENANKKGTVFTFISVVGTLTKYKKMDLLVASFIELYKLYPNIQLKLCGEGKLMEELKVYVSNVRMESHIEFLGVINNNDLPEVLSQCDCFVLPSVVETFGVVYIEAAGCGLPLIGANSGGTADIINKNNGIIIENAEIEDLTNAMQFVYENRELYNSEKISKDTIAKFGKEHFTEQMMEIYSKIS